MYGKPLSTPKTAQMTSIDRRHFYLHKRITQWSYIHGSLWLFSSYLSRQDGTIEQFQDHQNIHASLRTLQNKKQQKQPKNVQHQYLPETLVNTYKYHVILKSIPWYYMNWYRFMWNIVTYIYSPAEYAYVYTLWVYVP